MDFGGIINLAPLYLALPTLFVSLTLTNNPVNSNSSSELVFGDVYLIPIFQSLLFASLSLLILSILSRIGISESLNEFNLNNDIDLQENTKKKEDKFINKIVFLLFPLMCLFLSNNLLSPTRIVSIITILLLVNISAESSKNISCRVERNLSADDKITPALFYLKFQSLLIYLVSSIYDLAYSFYYRPEELSKIFTGYLVFLIPLLIFSNPFQSSFIEDNTTELPDLKTSSVLTFFSFLTLLYYKFEDYNFKMMFVAVGSLVILIFSQIDLQGLGKFTTSKISAKVFSNKELFQKNYKINLFILNIVLLIVMYLKEAEPSKKSQLDMISSFLKDNFMTLFLNFALILVISPNKNLNCTVKEIINNDNTADTEKIADNNQMLSLIIQLIHSKESKSIFNFLLLNMAFMFIQLLYSFRSKSLSLLSDSLHMLLDCTSLFLGLMASIIAKNNIENPSKKFPFGLARIETLAGFTNASLLLGIVFGIYNESIQRIFAPISLENTTELLIVSFLGFLVNIIGIFAFNHGDIHGHSHSHSHSHTHSHSHSHEHSHSHIPNASQNHVSHEEKEDHKHNCSNHQSNSNPEHRHGNLDDNNDQGKCCESEHEDQTCHESHGDHGNEEVNDNMNGIFLHIVADTLGSVGVILSTIIVKFTGWRLVDPITSIMIATLIFMSAIPLLKSSSSNLLLSLQDNTEKELKNVLNEVLSIPGVKSYTTPRFWPHDGASSQLVGYLHVQYFRTENSLMIRTKIDRLFEKSEKINKCYLQFENEVDDCWCRKEGVFSTS